MSSKSKRFVKQSVDALKLHEAKFPFRSTMAENDDSRKRNKQREETYLGGI